MKVTIYLLRKAGEPRIYTNTVGFDPGVQEKLEQDGFQLFKFIADLPDGDIPLVTSTASFNER